MKYHILIFVALLAIAACSKKPETAQALKEKITESVYASGTVKSKNQYQAFASVGGLVQKVLVQEGDLVKAGDPLLVIHSEAPRLSAENARLAADFAELNAQGERLSDLRSAIESSRSKMLNDSVLMARQRGLWAQQIGSKTELEQRELAFSLSKNSYESAVARYADLQKQLQFAADQARKQLSISQTIAQDYVVRSQTSGRVYQLAIKTGELVSPQMPLAVIGDAEAFLVELQVDEADIAQVLVGQRVFLTLDSYKGQVMEAVVAKMAPYMNERTRTFTVEATFAQQPPRLFPNLTAEANIVIRSKDVALTIPRSYLLPDTSVMVSEKEKRKVEIGLKDYQKVEILRGLQEGETIYSAAK